MLCNNFLKSQLEFCGHSSSQFVVTEVSNILELNRKMTFLLKLLMIMLYVNIPGLQKLDLKKKPVWWQYPMRAVMRNYQSTLCGLMV